MDLSAPPAITQGVDIRIFPVEVSIQSIDRLKSCREYDVFRFHFDAVPDHGGTEAVQVLAKARAFPFTVDLSTSDPVSLRLDLAKD